MLHISTSFKCKSFKLVLVETYKTFLSENWKWIFKGCFEVKIVHNFLLFQLLKVIEKALRESKVYDDKKLIKWNILNNSYFV